MYLDNLNNIRKKINCSRPVAKGNLTGYAKVLLQMKKDRRGYTKRELLDLAVPHIGEGLREGSYTRSVFCNEFSAMSFNHLLTYNYNTRLWYAGPRFDEYMDTYLSGYNA